MLTLKHFVTRHPAVALLVGFLSGLYFVEGHYLIASSCLLSTILFSYFLKGTLKWTPLFFGLLGTLIHLEEHRALESTSSILDEYGLTSLPIKTGTLEILKIEQKTKGSLVTFKTLDSKSKLMGSSAHLPKGVKLHTFTDYQFTIGDKVTLSGRTSRNKLYQNFGELDWVTFNKKRGIAGSIRVDQNSIEIIKHSIIRARIHEFRTHLTSSALQHLRLGLSAQDTAYSLIPALVFGNIAKDAEWVSSYREAGVMHLFVVSGLHVGMLIAFLWSVLYFTNFTPKQVIFISILCAWGYAWLTGLNAPVVRTSLVYTIYSCGLLLRLRVGALNSLFFALLLITMMDRYALNQVGVWLSFGVVTGIILTSHLGKSLFARFYQPDPYLPKSLWSKPQLFRDKIGTFFASSFIVGIVSWLCSSSITAFVFGRIYLAGAVSTWLLLPSAFCMLGLGSFSASVGGFLPALSSAINKLNNTLATHASKSIYTIENSRQTVWTLNDYGYHDSLTIFNTPYGGACLCLAAHGKALLIDSGGERVMKTHIKPALEQAGITVETILLSHKDTSHTGGHLLFPKASTIKSYEKVAEVHQFAGWTIETHSLAGSEFYRNDDHGALFIITKDNKSAAYIADAGILGIDPLQAIAPALHSDVLITGNHTYNENVIRDYTASLKAETVIFGRTTYHRSKMTSNHYNCIDQRYEGAVRVRWAEDALKVLSYKEAKTSQ